MAHAVAEAAAAKGMSASDSLRARAAEIEEALAASEAELDRQDAATRAAVQVRFPLLSSQHLVLSPSRETWHCVS